MAPSTRLKTRRFRGRIVEGVLCQNEDAAHRILQRGKTLAEKCWDLRLISKCRHASKLWYSALEGAQVGLVRSICTVEVISKSLSGYWEGDTRSMWRAITQPIFRQLTEAEGLVDGELKTQLLAVRRMISRRSSLPCEVECFTAVLQLCIQEDEKTWIRMNAEKVLRNQPHHASWVVRPLAQTQPETMWNTQGAGEIQLGSSAFCMTFNPDGTKFAIGSEYEVQVWDTATLCQERPFIPDTSALNHNNVSCRAVQFSPDGQFIAAICRGVLCSCQSTLFIWRVNTRELHWNSNVHYPGIWVVGFAFSPDCRWIAVLSDGNEFPDMDECRMIHGFDLETMNEVYQKNELDSYATLLATMNTRSGGVKVTCHEDDDYELHLSKKGWDWSVVFFSCGCSLSRLNGKEVTSKKRTAMEYFDEGRLKDRDVSGAMLSPDSSCILTRDLTDSARIRLWDLKHVGKVDQSQCPLPNVYCLAISSCGKWIASGGRDCTVRLWDAETLKEHSKSPLHGHVWTTQCNCLRFPMFNQVGIDPMCPCEGHTSEVHCVEFSSDGKWLLSGSDDGSIMLWDLEKMQLHPLGPALGHSQNNSKCTCYRNSFMKETVSQNILAAQCQASGHRHPVKQVEFSSDNAKFVSASWNSDGAERVVNLWDTKTLSRLGTFEADTLTLTRDVGQTVRDFTNLFCRKICTQCSKSTRGQVPHQNTLDTEHFRVSDGGQNFLRIHDVGQDVEVDAPRAVFFSSSAIQAIAGVRDRVAVVTRAGELLLLSVSLITH